MKVYLHSAVAAGGFLLSSIIGAVASAGILNAEIDGDTVTAEISLAGGVEADLTIEYEGVEDLTIANLGLTASLVNPLDAALLSRLPIGAASIPAGFPVLISISPDPTSDFAFDGVATIELYTTNINYLAGSPFRIFSAKAGEEFEDITLMNSGGSYRTRGGGGHYSDFLIVSDTRALSTVINEKLDALEDLLLSYQTHFSAANYAQLSGYVIDARNAWILGDDADAIDAMDDFEDKLVDWIEVDAVPNTWAASGGSPNVAGELRALAKTLRFSFTLAANAP